MVFIRFHPVAVFLSIFIFIAQFSSSRQLILIWFNVIDNQNRFPFPQIIIKKMKDMICMIGMWMKEKCTWKFGKSVLMIQRKRAHLGAERMKNKNHLHSYLRVSKLLFSYFPLSILQFNCFLPIQSLDVFACTLTPIKHTFCYTWSHHYEYECILAFIVIL